MPDATIPPSRVPRLRCDDCGAVIEGTACCRGASRYCGRCAVRHPLAMGPAARWLRDEVLAPPAVPIVATPAAPRAS